MGIFNNFLYFIIIIIIYTFEIIFIMSSFSVILWCHAGLYSTLNRNNGKKYTGISKWNTQNDILDIVRMMNNRGFQFVCFTSSVHQKKQQFYCLTQEQWK